MYAIGIGDWTDEYELRAIASDHYDTNAYCIEVQEFADLVNFRERFQNAICNSKYAIVSLLCQISYDFQLKRN